MHSVIEHILARKDKAVPVNDGRKIALVLYGGLMTGVCGAGALQAFKEMGLGKAMQYQLVFQMHVIFSPKMAEMRGVEVCLYIMKI